MAEVKSGTDSSKSSPHYSWAESSKRSYARGRKIGWDSYGKVDYRRLSKYFMLSGISSGYSARKKFEKKGKLPYWVDKD